MTTKLISLTADAEKMLVYIARVSSDNQENPEYAGLVKYLIKHKHWSPFEMAHAVFEIHTSRSIAAQILRHKSFSFQEFSQRYQQVTERPPIVAGRKQAVKNRQSSTNDLNPYAQARWEELQQLVYDTCYAAYEEALSIEVAREQARDLLPLATPTRMYMAGSIRSFIHFCELRCQPDTQHEHRLIAEGIRSILTQQLPTVAKALDWV